MFILQLWFLHILKLQIILALSVLSSFIFSAVLCEFWLLHYLVKIKSWIIFFPMLLIYQLFSGPLLSCFGPSFVCVLLITFGSLGIFHTHGMFHYEYFLEPLRTLLKPQTILELFPKSFCPCSRRILPVHFCISQMVSKHFIHSVNLFH